MAINILKDILISKNQIDKYFEGVAPVNLWRVLNIKQNTRPFDFVEQATILSNGRPRPADITIETVQGEKTRKPQSSGLKSPDSSVTRLNSLEPSATSSSALAPSLRWMGTDSRAGRPDPPQRTLSSHTGTENVRAGCD